jgi:drug/metabolite transporter (DMT)-like permease
MDAPSDDSFDRRGVALMLGSVALFAVNVLVIRAVSLAIPAADGWLATFFRGGIGLLVVAALYGFGRGLRLDRMFSSRLVVFRGVVGAITIIAFYVTVVKLGAGRAVILNLTYPIFGSLIAAVWLKEKVSRAALLWMAVALAGLSIFLHDGSRILRPSFYDLVALAGAVGAGWVVVAIRRLRHEEHPATIYASQAFYSLILAAPTAAKLPSLPPIAWWGLGLGAVIVAIGQLLMTCAYHTLNVTRGSALQMLLPLATAIGGVAAFGETYPPLEILGGALTLFATWRVIAAR